MSAIFALSVIAFGVFACALCIAAIRAFRAFDAIHENRQLARMRGEAFVASEVAKHNRAMREAGQAVIRG